MRFAGYTKKYDKSINCESQVEKSQRQTVLRKIVKKAALDWVEKHHNLNGASNLRQYLQNWHAVEVNAELNPQAKVQVRIYAVTGKGGYSLIKVYNLSKRDLFK